MKEDIESVVKDIRKKLESAWDDSTRYHKYKRPKGVTSDSAGQCGPSSVLLFSQLSSKFKNEKFSLAVGRVYSSGKERVIGKHVWVVWHKDYPSDSWIIDITFDQAIHNPKEYIFDSIQSLNDEDIFYQAYTLAYDLDGVDEEPKQRAKILESRLRLHEVKKQ